ncbi:hypothetical protein [Streptomyces nodosus]|uniref:Uncharacterized protein n=1 Tax=Streptomyces nodosus TaxID=40318 RepID=A0A0B5DK20_9ACTN|nr:hypothetical protein [Streptomyces nodosus]AJE41565.1 hypothetical protein SNOD_17185 [Streptomyces nodosus]MBB4792763.1 hypothetical protein [Streptomyces nodosus]QEV43334.1 hypothetical protein CP978_17475 [Streptomyces nodosus]
MTDRDWYDDSDYESAVERAKRMTRVGWAAIVGATVLMVVAAITAVVVLFAAFLGMVYILTLSDR